MAASGNANNSTSDAECAPMTTATSGAAAISTRLTSAWSGRAARSVRSSGARECSAMAASTSRKLTAKYATPASRTLGRSPPWIATGFSAAGWIPVRARASPAAPMLSVVCAALNELRCSALRWARPTARLDVALSSTATGNPQ